MAMEKENNGKTGGCTFQWKIKNINHCWWLRTQEEIPSPTFVADALQYTKWSFSVLKNEEGLLSLYLQREKDCCGPDSIEVFYELAILGKDGSILNTVVTRGNFTKGHCSDLYSLIDLERIFGPERELFISDGALTVQCKIWMTDEEASKLNNLFAISVMQVKWRSFECRIDKISTLKFDAKNIFEDELLVFDVILSEAINKLNVNITSINDSVKYVSCVYWILDLEGSKKNYEIVKYFAEDIDEVPISFVITLSGKEKGNKSRYFKDDVLSIHFQFVIGTVEHSSDRCTNSVMLESHVFKKGNTQNAKSLVDDLKSLYIDGIFSDIELCTSTKTFPTHKIILSSRSPVFRKILGNDKKEKDTRHVVIVDFDEDTVQRMLLFLYTDAFEDMQCESACKLYEIADKYEVLSLKRKCASFLIENLCLANACKVLAFSFLHTDEELNCVVQDYVIAQRRTFFRSRGWKKFMSSHIQHAADIMLRALNECA